jgi:predicted pyridoxine 5'-phosphate oxidase superfamily flavin-nucleotide-binding protein
MIVGHKDDQGQVWASFVIGQPGFITAVAADRVQINAWPDAHDPLADSLISPRAVGSLIIDFTQRRRLRINGIAQQQLLDRPSQSLREWEIIVSEAYNNCPKYIQRRSWQPVTNITNVDPAASHHLTEQTPSLPAPLITTALTAAQAKWIAESDTFFIASVYETADVSHRGGNPGFVQVVSSTQLCWPDYAGNGMFQTLGNITNNPATGLLWLDFITGARLQLTGQAHIDWTPSMAARFPGAERVIVWDIHQVRQLIPTINPLQWQFGQYSPFNPS